MYRETRRWDDNKESSHAMRSKEDAKDYRYFPDPDLPPIHISDAWIEELRESQPELREEKQLAISLNMIFRRMMQESLRNPDICPCCLKKWQNFVAARKSSKLVYGRSSSPDQGQRNGCGKSFLYTGASG